MKFKGMCYFCLLVACLTSSCTCTNVPTAPTAPTVPITPTEFIPSPELVEFVVDKVVLAQQTANIPGMVVAYVTGFKDPESADESGPIVSALRLEGEPESVIQVWRYEGGLVDVGEEVLQEALAGSGGPPITVVFALKSIGPNQVEADVHTWYDRGISESSRGGNAQKWTLEKQEEKWVVLDKDPYMYWD